MKKEEDLAAFVSITDELISLLDPLTEELLNRIPFAGSWTAGQLGDHLLKSYGVAELFNGRTAVTHRPADEKSQGIDKVFLDFSLKMKSPDFIVPREGQIAKTELLSDLRERIAGIAEFARSHDLSFTCLDFEFPGDGAMTAQEWLHFLGTHTRRHVHQLGKIVDALNRSGARE